jgi:hypothetical protein
VLDVAIRKADGSTAVDLGRRAAGTTPPLPVAEALRPVLPDGLRRGSTVTVAGSVSLLLAVLGAASADGAWAALVGFPRISAEAAGEYGIRLDRLALVPAPGPGWTTAVGALLDAVDLVAARIPHGRDITPGDIRRLAARARTRGAVLIPYRVGAGTAESWPGADVRLVAELGPWSGIGVGTGRLRARAVTVSASGRGASARPRSVQLWLPASGGGVDLAPAEHDLAPVLDDESPARFATDGLAPVIDLAG